MKWTIGSLSQPRLGETENGDRAVVRRTDRVTLVGIVDGLGHGHAAAKAADAASRCLDEARLDQGVESVMRDLHEGLAGTRGAAAILCLLQGDMLEGCGVGHVFFRCEPTRVPSLIGQGVLGVRLRRLRSFTSQLKVADRIVLTSDGISPHFALPDYGALSVDETCSEILKQHGSDRDDATVLVVDAEVE